MLLGKMLRRFGLDAIGYPKKTCCEIMMPTYEEKFEEPEYDADNDPANYDPERRVPDFAYKGRMLSQQETFDWLKYFARMTDDTIHVDAFFDRFFNEDLMAPIVIDEGGRDDPKDFVLKLPDNDCPVCKRIDAEMCFACHQLARTLDVLYPPKPARVPDKWDLPLAPGEGTPVLPEIDLDCMDDDEIRHLLGDEWREEMQRIEQWDMDFAHAITAPLSSDGDDTDEDETFVMSDV